MAHDWTATIDVSTSGLADHGKAEAEPRALIGEELWLSAFPSAAGVQVTERTALGLPGLLTAIKVLAEDIARLPLNVYQRQPDGSREPRRDHPLEYLLDVSPDGETTPFTWRSALVGHALQYGNGYAEIQRRGRGAPYALHILDPRGTRPVRREDRRLVYQHPGGEPIPAADVIHLAGFGPDGLSGWNLIRLLDQAVGMGLAAQLFGASYFEQGGTPGVILKSARKLSPEAKQNLRNSWFEIHGGPHKAHRPAVLEDGVELGGQIGTDPEKAQLLETRKFQLLDATRPYRVPANKLGDYSQAHYATVESSNIDYLNSALASWLTAIEQQFRLKLFSRAEIQAGYFIEHDTMALLRGDTKSRYEAYGLALNAGWMSRNEARRRENLPPIPAEEGGDSFFVQRQMVPLAIAMQAQADGLAASPELEPVEPPEPPEPDDDDTEPTED